MEGQLWEVKGLLSRSMPDFKQWCRLYRRGNLAPCKNCEVVAGGASPRRLRVAGDDGGYVSLWVIAVVRGWEIEIYIF